MLIRPEQPTDQTAIDRVTERAFAARSHTNHAEAAIVRALREDGDLTVSLVAHVGGRLAGHIAFSPITIDGRHRNWFGLGPLAVHPDEQRRGIGSALVGRGLEALRARAAAGCVVLGSPDFYSRFGFTSDGRMRYGALSRRLIQQLVFNENRYGDLRGDLPAGELRHVPAFDLAAA